MEEWPTESKKTQAESSEVIIRRKSSKVPVDLEFRSFLVAFCRLLGICVTTFGLASLILRMLTP